MIQDLSVQLYLDAAIEERCYADRGNLQFLMETLYRGVEFRNKRVLDIGGGCGRDSFYAASLGAREVVCLEPEADGSNTSVNDRFRRLQQRLGRDNVTLRSDTFQDFQPNGKQFDVVVLHNSINHLNEMACINLLADAESRATYHQLFAKIYQLSSNGAKLVVCDCSRYNLFALLNIRNPFATISSGININHPVCGQASCVTSGLSTQVFVGPRSIRCASGAAC